MSVDPKRIKRIGMLTPSSNTVLEPVTAAILADLADVTAHFGRFRVTEISLSTQALAQFDLAPILAASGLLADARVNAIVWNGTSAGWLGLEADRQLCEAIKTSTGIDADTSVLAMVDMFRKAGVRRLGLVSPYLDDIQAKIVSNFAREGFDCVAERHLRDRGNFSFAEVTEETIAEMIRDVAKSRPDAISVFCTNMRGAPIAAVLERETGIPVFDTVATGVWAGMRLVGERPDRIKGWGRVFSGIR